MKREDHLQSMKTVQYYGSKKDIIENDKIILYVWIRVPFIVIMTMLIVTSYIYRLHAPVAKLYFLVATLTLPGN